MTTYLLAWNPENFDWKELDDMVGKVQKRTDVTTWWSSGSTRYIEAGSRFFLMRCGQEPRGLIGSGTITSEPRSEPHWDKKRSADGDTARRIDIRFDTLARFPLIRRIELDAPQLADQKWDPQSSGISINEFVLGALEPLWEERRSSSTPTAYHLPGGALERWQSLTTAARGQSEWVERHRIRDDERATVLPQIASLISDFIGKRINLAQLKETFDRKTRNEWDVFGLKGNSGAMFLNKIVKHVPDQQRAELELRRVFAVPSSDEEARLRIDQFQRYLADLIEREESSVNELQPRRASFLISAVWHMQAPTVWPIVYPSAREAFKVDGIFGGVSPTGESYIEFCSLFRALAKELSLSFWEFEHLCARAAEKEKEVDSGEATGPDGAEDNDELSPRVWLYAPGPNASEWEQFFAEGVAAIGWPKLGDLSKFDSLDQLRDAIQDKYKSVRTPTHQTNACWEFVHEMQPGDVIFAKKGRKHIVGYGIVKSAYRHEPERGEFSNVRDVEWKLQGDWIPRDKPMVTKTLTNIGAYAGLVAQIRAALGLDEGEELEPAIAFEGSRPRYLLADAHKDLFVSELWLERTLALLRYKKNIVLQGPPGVGKTFVAKRLAYLLLGEKDPDRVRQVQFHASYSYEDFIQGYRPTGSGAFDRVDGPFFEFCDEALQDPTRPYVFVIDEINRGNLSKIFGELLMLLEADKRSKEWAARLTYSRSDEPPFFVPPNLHVVGTMNTADRSLAMVDYALRRRFAFIELEPAINSDAFDHRLGELGVSSALRKRIVSRLGALNAVIADDRTLGGGFCIGHSYFCSLPDGTVPDDDWYQRIIDSEIEPLLREYWFDNDERARSEAARLRGD